MEQQKEYYAFISYKREDEKWAKWLQHKLEHYKLPSNLNGRTDLPRQIRPVFRDTSELNPGNLPQQIHDALEASKFLIVVCSPRSARSEWVNREIETFIAMGKKNFIIPFVIDGSPHAADSAEECFPPAILNLPADQELLGANVGEMGRDAAVVKTVAQMFGVRFDTLWKRFEREQKRKRSVIIAVVAFFFLAVLGVAAYIWRQARDLQVAVDGYQTNLSRVLSEKATALVDEGDSYLARMLCLEALPPNRPYTPEAETALRKALQHDNAILRGHTDEVRSVSFSPDGKTIVSASFDHTVRIWDTKSGWQVGAPLRGHTDFVHSASFSPDGKYIVSASSDETIRIWDAKTGLQVGRPLEGHTGSVESASFSPDGKYIVSASSDYTIRSWDAMTGLQVGRPLEGHTALVNSASFSPDGKYIVSASDDNTVRIWDAKTGQQLGSPLEGSIYSVNSASFSPDGKYIVSAYLDRTVRIWDAKTGLQVGAPLQGHTRSVNSASFSPDGKYIVSASEDETVRIWDAKTGRQVGTPLEGHTDPVWSASFSPDGRHIVSASADNTIRIWDFPPLQELIDQTRERFKSRQLTPEERRKYYLE